MGTRYGFDEETWECACAEAREFLVGCARARRTTTYGELSSAVCSARVRPYSFAMTALISEACEPVDERFGTVLASLVCRKDTGMPGEGYFTWGDRTGRCNGTRRAWWESELRNVYDRLSSRSPMVS